MKKQSVFPLSTMSIKLGSNKRGEYYILFVISSQAFLWADDAVPADSWGKD